MKASGAAGEARERIGVELERGLTVVEEQTASPGRAVLLGAGLAGVTVLCGIGAFVIVWALLVGVAG